MTMRFMAGMGGFNTAQLNRKWDTVSANASVNATGGRRSGPSLRFNNWNSDTRKILDNQSNWIIGFAFKCSALPAVNTQLIMGVLDTGSSTQASIGVMSTGQIRAFRDWPPGGQTLGTSTAVITPGTFCYLEVKFVIHDTLGSVEVRKDGATILNVTNVDTKQTANAFAGTILWPVTSGNESVTLDYDDIYVCDGNGTTNNNFLGDLRIDSVFPNGVGNSSGWTPSAGSNWQNVDDDPSNDDTDYNASGVPGVKDTYAFPDIPPTVGNVVAVAHNITVRKDDSLTHTFRDVVRRGGTDYPGTTKTATGSYVMYTEIKETDPSTSAAWTIANLNLAEFGAEVVS